MNDTQITYRTFEGFFINGYKLHDIIFFDEAGKEYIYNIVEANTHNLTFKFETKRKLKKELSKRIPFIIKNGHDIFDSAAYDLYIPSELVNFKYVGDRENVRETGYIYKYKDCTFEGYVYNPYGVAPNQLKTLKFSTLKMEKTNELLELEVLASEINACSYGLKITPYELKDILKKFDIVRKPGNYMVTST